VVVGLGGPARQRAVADHDEEVLEELDFQGLLLHPRELDGDLDGLGGLPGVGGWPPVHGDQGLEELAGPEVAEGR
jgi:hypothetical protein